MADLTLDGLDIRDRASIFFDLMSGYYEPAEVRGSDTIVPALDGRVVRNRVIDSRRIRLDGYVTGTDTTDWAANTSNLMAACNAVTRVDLVIDDGYLGTVGTPTISVLLVNAIPGPPTYGVLYQSWSLEFESIAPDWT